MPRNLRSNAAAVAVDADASLNAADAASSNAAASTSSNAAASTSPDAAGVQKKPKLRVLSLFDGIGTGLYALSLLDFDLEVYYASEIDTDALRVTRHNFAGSITHLGCVKQITIETINKIGPIDLLLGGSPCTDLSCVNVSRRGLFNEKGTGPLFFDFYRIKTMLDLKRRPYYWMFENVANMETKFKDEITMFLGCEPSIVNSKSMTAQCRKRLFWTNIPGAYDSINVDENGPKLEDYLDSNLGRQANVKKVGTITTKRSCLQDGSSRDPVSENGIITGLYITEIEKIFGFPAHFTDVGDMTPARRQKLLGRAWSVPVVKAILQPLTKIFATK